MVFLTAEVWLEKASSVVFWAAGYYWAYERMGCEVMLSPPPFLSFMVLIETGGMERPLPIDTIMRLICFESLGSVCGFPAGGHQTPNVIGMNWSIGHLSFQVTNSESIAKWMGLIDVCMDMTFPSLFGLLLSLKWIKMSGILITHYGQFFLFMLIIIIVINKMNICIWWVNANHNKNDPL